MSAPVSHDPLVVNTRDGVCWERRAVTSDGRGLYAVEGSCKCPEFVMATLAELAEHGIVGSARVLPVPVGTAPQPLSVDPRIELIRRERTHCEAAQFESEDDRPLHVWGPSQYPKREMCQRCTLSREWAEDPEATDVVLLAEVDRLRARVAELESERAAWRRTAHRLAGEAGLIPKSVEGEHYAVTHHAYRVGRDLPEAGAQ